MPLVFIHGVRQRNPEGLARLTNEFRGMLGSVRERVALSTTIEVCAPYWGGDGAVLRDENDIPPLFEFGAESALLQDDPLSQLLRMYAFDELAVTRVLRAMAAQQGMPPDERQALEALLSSDLRKAYDRYLTLPRHPAPGLGFESATPRSVLVERSALQWLSDLVQRGVSQAVLAMPLMSELYADIHDNFALFVGDAMTYVIQRERHGAQGQILHKVLSALPEQRSASDPLIVVTHSMGGTIFYDIVTHFRPDLKVDCWISVGSQVSRFQRLGLMANQAHDRDAARGAIDNRVNGLEARIHRWYNIYDPLDPLNFIASTVFPGARDVQYKTARGPLRSHSWYFREARFYALVADQIVEALTTRPA